MQQTEKYQFNLIEPSDVFSPEPLNQNMEKTEEQFTAEAAARQSADSALERRIAVLEARKLVTGSYTGDGTYRRVISLGFTPKLVYVHTNVIDGTDGLAFPGLPTPGQMGNMELEIVDGGFKTYGQHLNVSSYTYYYIAVL
ncbi:MAG: hypothetical protein K2P01_02245 [Oscillospiraceae bacterium]|nr:hypothetical protein [Oscillospiraceae bacterium]